MIRKAIVAGIGEDWIDCLSLDETERAHDEACGTGGSCDSSGCGCRVSGRPFRAARPRDIVVNVGDTVEVSAPATRAFLASLAVLGLPILGGVIGWIAVGRAVPSIPDGARAGVAAASLVAVAYIAVRLGGRRREDRLPEITAVAG